uniref:Rubicon like autophagy enhancer n=1 Tax=Kryptolebias marmoratus TaxID=37003 RepID=A0A3Q3BFH4_KRYMA
MCFQENAHFIVVDLVLEVLEGAKCTLGFNHWTSTMDKHQDTHCKMRTKKQRCSAEDTPPHRQACGIHKHMHSDKVTRTHSCSWCENDGEPASYESDHQKKSLSFLSTDSGFEGTEGVEVSSGSLSEEIRLRTRMRGTLNWAPPRFQIVFSIQPPQRSSPQLILFLPPGYIKKLRYCDYLGRYFCDCCHSSSDAVIPGRVLSCWDFSRYSVSDFSKQLLDSVWYQPLFDLTCVGKTLYGRVKELDRFRELQEQLLEMRKLLKACRLSKRVLAELEQLPAHLMEQPLLFSMEDLLKAKKGQLVAPARALLIIHLLKIFLTFPTQLCLARGFICEFCREKDIIFPFQRDICKRCVVCKACFHKHCFVEKKCPKCTRIRSRTKFQMQL